MKRKITIDRSKCGQIGRNVLSGRNQNDTSSYKAKLVRRL